MARRATSPARQGRSNARKSGSTLSVEAFASASPAKRVLVSVKMSGSLEELHDAVGVRLKIPTPGELYFGHSYAKIVSLADLHNGDTVRVEAVPRAPDEASSPRDKILRLLITIVIFVALEGAFQRWIFVPYFRPHM